MPRLHEGLKYRARQSLAASILVKMSCKTEPCTSIRQLTAW